LEKTTQGNDEVMRINYKGKQLYISKKPVISSDDIIKINGRVDKRGLISIRGKLTKKGQKAFTDFTSRNMNKLVCVMCCDKPMAVPKIMGNAKEIDIWLTKNY